VNVVWDESFFDHGRVEEPIYWVCFWTEAQDSTAMHDPVRIDGAGSVNEVLAWVRETLGSRGYELFVEANDHAESREQGWVDRKQLVRLSGNYRPPSTVVAIAAFKTDDSLGE
jgi:hypothetical protein